MLLKPFKVWIFRLLSHLQFLLFGPKKIRLLSISGGVGETGSNAAAKSHGSILIIHWPDVSWNTFPKLLFNVSRININVFNF